MSIQLRLPVLLRESRRDPRDRLEHLKRDVLDTKAKIRAALDDLAERHGIGARDIAYAVDGYADDMLADAIYNVERELEHEIEAQDPL